MEQENGTSLIVDVRTAQEYAMMHAKGAIHVDLNDIANGSIPIKDTSKKLYLYCASGSRSGLATNILKSAGYDAHNIGGLHAWHRGGGEVEYT